MPTSTQAESKIEKEAGTGSTKQWANYSGAKLGPDPSPSQPRRSIWQDSLFEWFNSGPQHPPHRDDAFWSNARVFVERVELAELRPRDDSGSTPLALRLRVHGLHDDRLWQFLRSHEDKFRGGIAEAVKNATNGRISLSDISFQRGSITIAATLTAASVALAPFAPLLMLVGIFISLLSLIANYPNFKRGVSELGRDARAAIEAIDAFLTDFFWNYDEPGFV